MSTCAFRAMGTDWWVSSDGPGVGEVAGWVSEIERSLSRFIGGSSLCRLNADRIVADGRVAEVTRVALALRQLTDGAFDPCLGATLAALGYDRSFEQIGVAQPRRVVSELRVEIERDVVALRGSGALDLGGIAKGWAVDHVHDRLVRTGGRRVLVDGGGDMRGSGAPWPIGVGVDRAILLADGGVATSSAAHRAWSTPSGARMHHIVDPGTGEPARNNVVTAVVCAPTAALADGLATALVARPDRVLGRLQGLGVSALIEDEQGRWWSTDGWQEAA